MKKIRFSGVNNICLSRQFENDIMSSFFTLYVSLTYVSNAFSTGIGESIEFSRIISMYLQSAVCNIMLSMLSDINNTWFCGWQTRYLYLYILTSFKGNFFQHYLWCSYAKCFLIFLLSEFVIHQHWTLVFTSPPDVYSIFTTYKVAVLNLNFMKY